VSELGFRTTYRVKPRRGRSCLAVFIAFAVLAGGVGFVVIKGKEFLLNVFTVQDYRGPGRGEVVVQVLPGDTIRQIAATLEDKDVVKSAEAFVRAARKDPRALSIQPGYYRLREQMAAAQALTLILDPDARIVNQVTIPEGKRVGEILTILSEQTNIPRSEFEKVLKDKDALNLPAYAKGNVEGMLFPATYEVDPGTTAESLLQSMTAEHIEVSEEIDLEANARRLGRTPLQVITVASLVQAEARRESDFRKVARVIYNRLAAHQLLQLDSTVHFAVNRYDKIVTTSKQRASSSAYNTYKHVGLPPGPINAPGKRALLAALHPAPGDWMYFVTTNPDTGETKFAVTYAEHQTNVAEFRRWCSKHPGRCRS